MPSKHLLFLASFFLLPSVGACEGDCIVGVTNAWTGNYTTPVTAVLENFVRRTLSSVPFGALARLQRVGLRVVYCPFGPLTHSIMMQGMQIANLMLPPAARPTSGLDITQPILSAWQSTDTYYGMRTAIFPSYFHGKCLLPANGSSISTDGADPLQEGIEAPGCPDTANCSVVCGVPGSLVHFFPVLTQIAYNASLEALTNYTTEGDDAFDTIANNMLQRMLAANVTANDTDPTSARFAKRYLKTSRAVDLSSSKKVDRSVRRMGVKVPFPMRLRLREIQQEQENAHIHHSASASVNSSLNTKTKGKSLRKYDTADAAVRAKVQAKVAAHPRAFPRPHETHHLSGSAPKDLSTTLSTTTTLHATTSKSEKRSRLEPRQTDNGNWSMANEVKDGLSSIFFNLPTLLSQACSGQTLPSPDAPAAPQGVPGEPAPTPDSDSLTACSWQDAMEAFILTFQ